MSKIDSRVINNIRMLSLDMIRDTKYGDSLLALSTPNVFYSLFMYHLNYNNKDPYWINRDRLIISNRMLPAYYSSLYLFGFDYNIDNLKEYKKYGSKTLGFMNDSISDLVSENAGDSLGFAAGVALGERYLETLTNKTNLINYKTYVICDYNDIMNGTGFESLSYISKEKLNKIIIILIKERQLNDTDSNLVYNDKINSILKNLNFNIVEVDENKFKQIDEAIDDAKDSKKPSIVIINTDYNHYNLSNKYTNLHNEALNDEDINKLSSLYNINESYNISRDLLKEINKNIEKRLEKTIIKWNTYRNNVLANDNLKYVLDFLEQNDLKINYNYENLKINDNYNEELLKGNSKIFNIFASKSPFVFSLSDDNIKNSLCSINNSTIMSIHTPNGRNILLGRRTNLLGSLSIGLSYLGFKVFVSTNLLNSNNLNRYIKFSARNNLNITYIFTNDSFLDTYEGSGISATNELDNLRSIPNLINFRPCDINEIIGLYGIISTSKKPTTILLSNKKLPMLDTTSSKYVMGGMYRVLKEVGNPNGILIASGEEVHTAIKIANDLSVYGINLRVISAPSTDLFETQNEKYKSMLIPKNIRCFVIDYSISNYWNKYATDNTYIFGINKYGTNGSTNELLKYFDLDIDEIKTRIVEKYKS